VGRLAAPCLISEQPRDRPPFQLSPAGARERLWSLRKGLACGLDPPQLKASDVTGPMTAGGQGNW